MPSVTKAAVKTATSNRPAPKPSSQKGGVDENDAWGLSDGIRILIYGQSGTGKTTVWSTFPGPILMLQCSGGSRSGELRSIDTPEMRAKVTARKVRTFAEFNREVEGVEGNYGTVVLDHATGFADMLLSEIIGKPVPEQKGWGLAQQQDWGQMGLRFKENVRRMLDLSCNVVIVAQERTFGGKDDGGNPDLIAPSVGAALTPSVAGWLNVSCDYVVQTFKRPVTREVKRTVGAKEFSSREKTGDIEYCLRCSPHEVYLTKFRRPGGINGELVLVNPTYDSIIEAIRTGGE